MYVACTNCEDTKEVKLRNDLGQVYEIRKCPVCICKACGGTGRVTDGEGRWSCTSQCWMCGPQRFSAHVGAYRKHMWMSSMPKFEVRPGEITVLDELGEPMWPRAFLRPKTKSFIEWIKSLCK